MTRSHDARHSAPQDIYAAYRCVRCFHLRYHGQKPGDPCKVCPCTKHIVPGEVTGDDAPTP
jgi:hypothetical protein